ncbi:DUF502 domain-containing protein [Persicitalea jodogahamensis]|uniref:DUF502 domain-containing protein n=1 Tax=Persicitalea jodogahamensis TaxID=402147 RepID=A0A8J3D0V7_9BACT|nr:DUF502 domain-containing protein [Persicitalea jodogahamensis]GHB60077.1 hypothetical protein GCM10007390_12240 [Persicitalea jodogahamensis]
MNSPFLNRIFGYFVRGLVLVAPLYFTILIIWTGVEALDGILPVSIPISAKKTIYLPGLGMLIILLGILLLGFFFSTVVPQSFFRFTERILRKIPLVNLIFYSIKDLISAFVGDKKKFNQPVLVTINRESDVKKLGFITQTDLSHLYIKDYIAVYMPHSYAFSGELFIVPIANVTLLNANSADIMKMIVSGGVSAKDYSPEYEEEEG